MGSTANYASQPNSNNKSRRSLSIATGLTKVSQVYHHFGEFLLNLVLGIIKPDYRLFKCGTVHGTRVTFILPHGR